MAHTCEAVLIHCMDFRLIDKIREWMGSNGYLGNCDVVSLAGASKSLADGSGETVLSQIRISTSLHKAGKVLILHHSDCGAYKSAYDFKTPDEEKNKQLEDMAKAERIIKDKFGEVEILKVWAEMKDEEGKAVSFEEIAD